MGGGQVRQAVLTVGGELEAHDALVGVIGDPPEEAGALRPVDELDRAVVAEEEVGGHVAHRRPALVPAHGEQ